MLTKNNQFPALSLGTKSELSIETPDTQVKQELEKAIASLQAIIVLFETIELK